MSSVQGAEQDNGVLGSRGDSDIPTRLAAPGPEKQKKGGPKARRLIGYVSYQWAADHATRAARGARGVPVATTGTAPRDRCAYLPPPPPASCSNPPFPLGSLTGRILCKQVKIDATPAADALRLASIISPQRMYMCTLWGHSRQESLSWRQKYTYIIRMVSAPCCSSRKTVTSCSACVRPHRPACYALCIECGLCTAEGAFRPGRDQLCKRAIVLQRRCRYHAALYKIKQAARKFCLQFEWRWR